MQGSKRSVLLFLLHAMSFPPKGHGGNNLYLQPCHSRDFHPRSVSTQTTPSNSHTDRLAAAE